MRLVRPLLPPQLGVLLLLPPRPVRVCTPHESVIRRRILRVLVTRPLGEEFVDHPLDLGYPVLAPGERGLLHHLVP